MVSQTRRTALVLFLLAAGVYLFPLAYNHFRAPFFAPAPSSDVIPASLISVSLLRTGDFYLDEYADDFSKIASNWGTNLPYFVVSVNNHLVSDYPIAAGILALPFDGLALAAGWITTPTDALLLAKFAAAWITACSVAAFFFCSRELADLRTSTLAAISFAFGTSIWSTESQGLWQHTASVLFQTIAFWFLLRGKRKDATAIAPAGLFLSAAVAARPNNITTALIFLAYVLLEYRRALATFLTWAAAPALLVLAYNTAVNGSPLTFGFEGASLSQWTAPSLLSLAGLLFSPSRGLLFFSPFLILAPLGLWIARRDVQHWFYVYTAVAAGVFIFTLSAWGDWWGGWGYGPRLVTDALPLASLLLLPVLARLRGIGVSVFGLVVAYGALLQTLGLWDYGVQWHYQVGTDPSVFWNLGTSEPGFYLGKISAMIGKFLQR
jgi:hypothetical protein